METLKIIEKHLDIAKREWKERNPFSRDRALLEAFAQLEAERLKFYVFGDYNLGKLGNELNDAISSLNTCIFQFTHESCIDEKEWQFTINIRLETLEHYIIKAMAIMQILCSKENCNIPIKICGVKNREEIGVEEVASI